MGSPSAYGLWFISLQVWDGGAGHETTMLKTGVSGIQDGHVGKDDVFLSPARPNPSGDRVSWDLHLQATTSVTVAIIGVDGRCIRSWTRQSLPAGVTRIFWDGTNNRGERVASGVYYLSVENRDGRAISSSVRIVR